MASLDVAGRDCLVVGGGRRALVAVQHLVGNGAAVTVVAPRLHPALHAKTADGRITHWATSFAPGQLRGMPRVVPATGDRLIDAAVCLAAQARGILIIRMETEEAAARAPCAAGG